MPIISAAAGLSSRSLGLASGIIAGPATIDSISGILNGTTGTQLSVSFTAGRAGSSPVTNYQYSVNNGSTWNTFSPAQTTSPLIISGLTNGTTYTVKIRSLQGNQSSDASNAVTGRPVALPSAPSITAVANDVNSTTGQTSQLTFTASTAGTDSITNYEYSIDGASSWIVRSPAATTSPISISSLTNGTSYQVALRAVTSQGHTSAASSLATARPVALPGAPTISSITASTGQLSVAFTAGSAGTDAAQTYEYSLNNGSTWAARATGTTGSPLVITGVTDATVVSGGYTVRIRQVTNQQHRSAQSSGVVPSATPPEAPVLTSASVTPTSITVNFTSAVAGSYAINRHERSLDGTNWSTYTSGTAITGLSTSTSYTVRVRAVDVQGVAGPFSYVTASTSAEVAPSAPTVSASPLTTASIRITWTGNAAGTYSIQQHEYRVVYWANNQWNLLPDWTVAASGTIDVGSLPYPDYTYYVQMRAKASSPGTTYSSVTQVSVVTNSPTPSAPSISFRTEDASERATAKLQWAAIPYATNYHIHKDNSYYSQTTDLTADVAVTAGSSHNFRVYAINKHGTASVASNIKTMTVGNTGVAWTQTNTETRYFGLQGPCNYEYIGSLITTLGTVPSSSSTAGYIYINTMSYEVAQIPGGGLSYTTSSTRSLSYRTTGTLPNGFTNTFGFLIKSVGGLGLDTNWRTQSTAINLGGTDISGAIFSIFPSGNGWGSYNSCTANDIGIAYSLRGRNLTLSGTQTTASTYGNA